MHSALPSTTPLAPVVFAMALVSMATMALGAAGCDDKRGGPAAGASSQAASTATSGGGPGSPGGAATAKPEAKPETAEPGSAAELAKHAAGVLDALKKGDAKAAADFCKGKHRDGLEKYIVELLEKKDQSRAKAVAAWDGKLGEMRVDGDQARVAYGTEGGHVDYLSFRKKDGSWSLFDFPVAAEKEWKAWGTVVTK